ncbi:MAG: hypothetical protein HFF83_04325 [Oscillibacter sp.]|nr:hypothetical protein [Oscillibacter sp.]
MKGYYSPGGGFGLSADGMRYREFDFGNPVCLHVVLSSRAYAGILSQALRDVREETGGVFLGRVHNRIWYVMEAVTLPFSEAPAVFSWEPEEVRRIAEFCRGLYQEPLEVLGFWHRHPPHMDYFSPEDEQVLQSGQWPHGQLAMLVNADPDLRLSFYCCNGMELMPAEYDHGDEYFLEELLACPDPETLAERYHSQVRVRPHRDMEPEQLPQSLYQRPEAESGKAKGKSSQIQARSGKAKRKSGQVQAESGKAEKKTGQVQAESGKKEAKSPESAAGEALARELMRRLEEATTRMPSSYMARLRDQNERILALLEELLREELLREQETLPVPERVPEAAERPLETADGPSELPKKEEGEVSGRINDLRVKYATEGGRRGWGV